MEKEGKLVIKNNSDVRENYVEEKGNKDVLKKILIGLEDGSDNIIMRYFKILPQGNTPFHSHDHEHVVKIEKGQGVVVDGAGEETIIREGQSLFIRKNEKHQFKNPFQKLFEFLCIIINPEKETRKK